MNGGGTKWNKNMSGLKKIIKKTTIKALNKWIEQKGITVP